MYDVDLKERVLFIRLGKGRKDRIVPIGKSAAKRLESYLHSARPKTDAGRNEGFVFESFGISPVRRLCSCTSQKIPDCYRDQKVGIPAHVKAHLRHAFTSARRGYPLHPKALGPQAPGNNASLHQGHAHGGETDPREDASK